MDILITGGNGFVGRSFQREYFTEHHITSIDLCDKRDALFPSRFHCVDFTKELSIDNDYFDGILHLGGVSRVKDGESNPGLCFETNIQGTVNVFDYAIKNNISWVLIGSTIEGIDNAYGLSKKIVNDISKYYSTRGLKVGVIKFSSIYGSNLDNPEKLIPTLVSQAIEGVDIIINDGSVMIDFIHINDVVKGLSKAVDYISNGKNKPHFFEVSLGSGVETSLEELGSLIIKTFKSSSSVKIIDNNPKNVIDYKFSEFDSLIEYFPRISLEEGIRLFGREFV